MIGALLVGDNQKDIWTIMHLRLLARFQAIDDVVLPPAPKRKTGMAIPESDRRAAPFGSRRSVSIFAMRLS